MSCWPPSPFETALARPWWRAGGPLLCLAALGLALAACRRSPPPAPVAADASGAASGAAAPLAAGAAARITALRSAEDRRDPGAVTAADLGHPEVRVRRQAARALARIASDEARAGLLRLLPDEDAETSAFAAYGLGYSCQRHEDETVSALVARAATLPPASGPARFDPGWALARALGRCATAEAEASLVAWLRGARRLAAPAALGLGDTAGRRKLQDDSWVALTQAAAGSAGSPPLPEALYALGRAEAGKGLAPRVREVASAALGQPGDAPLFAARALGRVPAESEGGEASAALAKVLTDPAAASPAVRAEAARALGRLGEAGQRALGESLSAIAPANDRLALAGLVADGYGPLAVAVDSLESAPSPRAREALGELSRLALPAGDEAPRSIVRRVVHLRCAAARALAAPGAVDDPLLAACDPEPGGQEGELARARVLGKHPVDGPRRRAALRALAASPHARVRAAVYELLGAHREADDAGPLVLSALASGRAGDVSQAAEVVTARPELAAPDAPGGKGAEIAKAIVAALEKSWAPDDGETVATLASAAGAAHLEGARPALARLCLSPEPTLRARAESALGLLGDKSARCPPPAARPAEAEELARSGGEARIVLDTDAGELEIELDTALAPVASARLVDLVRAGFFDGMAVHRVVPGFVVQFGDRDGDSLGGAGKPPLRCETSPLPYAKLAVGVALAGRDTGSSQFFVTLSRTPHLDGDYALIGRASGDWAAVTEGDRIRKARVVQ